MTRVIAKALLVALAVTALAPAWPARALAVEVEGPSVLAAHQADPAAAEVTLRRLRCARWDFVPPSTTVCQAGTADSVRVRRVGSRVLAFSARRDRWVDIPYTYRAATRRLEFDAAKTRVAQPAVGATATVTRFTCRRWRLVSESGPTTCLSGRAERVLARFDTLGGRARVRSAATGGFVGGPYRWESAGGYLRLDARLVPAASVDLGPTMYPRPSASVTDYVVRCDSGSVTARVAARAGGSVTFDGSPLASSATRVAALEEGQSVRWTLVVPGRRSVAQQARCLPAGMPPIAATRTGVPSSQWILLTPALGLAAPAPGEPNYVVLVDSHGTPVWWRGFTDHRPIDAKVLPSGQLAWAGAGFAFSLIAEYRTSGWDGSPGRTYGAGLGLDHHDLQPMSNGHFLAVRYVLGDCPGGADCLDMTGYGGSARAPGIYAEVVELDADGAIVWTWKARDHIPLTDWSDLDSVAHRDYGLTYIGDQDLWDVHHINSVEPDGDGFIVSMRHTNAVYRIRRSDGSVDWKLGGSTTAQSLAVVGSGITPLLQSQHDARRLANGHIMLFDNGSEAQRAPRGLEISVDPVGRTAEVVSSRADAGVPLSPCCGSVRPLSTGGWVTAWGGTGIVTESDASGKRVLTLDTGGVFTYRAVPLEPGVVSRRVVIAGMDSMNPRAG